MRQIAHILTPIIALLLFSLPTLAHPSAKEAEQREVGPFKLGDPVERLYQILDREEIPLRYVEESEVMSQEEPFEFDRSSPFEYNIMIDGARTFYIPTLELAEDVVVEWVVLVYYNDELILVTFSEPDPIKENLKKWLYRNYNRPKLKTRERGNIIFPNRDGSKSTRIGLASYEYWEADYERVIFCLIKGKVKLQGGKYNVIHTVALADMETFTTIIPQHLPEEILRSHIE